MYVCTYIRMVHACKSTHTPFVCLAVILLCCLDWYILIIMLLLRYVCVGG